MPTIATKKQKKVKDICGTTEADLTGEHRNVIIVLW